MLFFHKPEPIRDMADQQGQAGKSIGGISLAAFLQLLEQERKSCTLIVNQNNREGKLFFHDGELVDAEYAGVMGLEAVYAILSWEEPHFSLAAAEERIHRISHPLTHIILTASAQSDEEREDGAGTQDRTANVPAGASPGLPGLIDQLIAIPGVKHYYLLNRQGKMITQSSKNQKIGDFIAYTIVSGIQMREALEAKGLHHVRIRLQDGSMLLIVPQGGRSGIFSVTLVHDIPPSRVT
jgi:hypothetical protein